MTAAQRHAYSRQWLDRPIESLRLELGRALIAYVEAKQQRLPLDEFRDRQDRLDALMAAWPERSFVHPRRPLMIARTRFGELVLVKIKQGKPRGPHIGAKGGAS